tara:strand:+ start:3200 stop:3838 length:639 start_codon:yes stop_codon:yes gene_type:complete
MPETKCLHFSLPLLLDASSPKVQVGVPEAKGWRALHCAEEPALTSIFQGVQRCLEEIGDRAVDVDAILFCEGPGSTLGIRAALTLAKTLQSQVSPPPANFVYNSLHAASLLCEKPDKPILADYRQGQWYLRESSGEIRVIEDAEALEIASDCQGLRQRKSWKKLPAIGPDVDYDLSRLNGLESLATILHPIDQPALFDLRPATFRKWTEAED